MRPGKAPDRFSEKLRVGFCLGCGGETRWVRNHFKRFGKDGDSLNWHRSCYARFRYRWTIGLKLAQGYEHTCEVCGKRFMAAGRGAWIRMTCSEECRYQRTLAKALERAKLRPSRRLPGHERACVICGNLFPVGGGLGKARKKTCSPACRQLRKRQTTAAWQRRRRGPLFVHRFTCVVCGKRFSAKSHKAVTRKTCSISCRVRWARLRNAAWGKARRLGKSLPRKKKEILGGTQKEGPRAEEAGSEEMKHPHPFSLP